ncbi:MAG TPA: KGG domain-containing protein [Mucilaginibacter sp.]|nr:KGG domain-containing protein [Mucilaginibacter sp.]
MPTTEKGQTGHSNQGNRGKAQGSNSGNFANMDEQKRKETASKGGKSHSGSKGH